MNTELIKWQEQPKEVLFKWAHAAFWHAVLFGPHERNPPKLWKPCEYWQTMIPEEEKEIMRGLKSEDIANLRMDPVWCSSEMNWDRYKVLKERAKVSLQS